MSNSPEKPKSSLEEEAKKINRDNALAALARETDLKQREGYEQLARDFGADEEQIDAASGRSLEQGL